MSSNAVLTFQAKPGQEGRLLEFLSGFQDRLVEAGALTASLMQDQADPAHFLEVDVWQSVEEHKKVVEAATAGGEMKVLEELLASPMQISYLETVRFSRSRQR